MIYSKGPLAYKEYIEKRQEQLSGIQKEKEEAKALLERTKEEEAKLREKQRRDMERYSNSPIVLYPNLSLICRCDCSIDNKN